MQTHSDAYHARMPVTRLREVDLPVFGFSLHYAARPDPPRPDRYKRRTYHLLGWVEAGEERADLEGDAFPLRAGEATVLPPDRTSGFTAPSGCLRYGLKFTGPQAAAILHGLGIATGAALKAGPPPAELFRRLAEAIADPSPAGTVEVSRCTYELLALLAARRYRRGEHPVVRRALAVLEAEWNDEGLNATTLARRVGVHRSALAQRFGEAFGIGPAAYLRRMRVRRALTLLEEGRLSVAEVARACGVPPGSRFSRLIRRETGRSPRAIRAGE